ncbi:MAG TPA: hypothetical protein VKA27_09960 [Sunxiuqinia sp.]|nr:hypothetical protein [Sunxiuqinia sp.]
MKKRDFYILGFLFCLIVYAAFNRKSAINTSQANHQELLVPKAQSGVESVKVDSIVNRSEQVIKAGV